MIWIILSVVLCGLATGAIYFALRVLRAQASRSVGREREILRGEIVRYDNAIEAILGTLNKMMSLEELAGIEGLKEQALAATAAERERVKKIERDLEALQERVDKQEAKHNELKKGKEDSEKLADDLRVNKDLLAEEAKKLQAEVVQGREQITKMIASTKVDPEQQKALDEILGSQQKVADQLKEVSEVHGRAAVRFMNLEKQFSELEKEFRKLINKELSGEPAS